MIERRRGRAGMRQRQRRLAAEPLCRDCAAEGRVTVATVPDHIVPLAKGGSDTDDNIRCLCEEHHRKRTAEQFGQTYRPRAVIGADGWPRWRESDELRGVPRNLQTSTADTGGQLQNHNDLPRSNFRHRGTS